MVNLSCDYICGCHSKILEALSKTNMEALPGYGDDKYTLRAKKKILKECGLKNGDVYFITGGTQTNQCIISTMLKPYEGVISASTGHVGVHEAGAIEYSGHKVLTIQDKNGKISALQIKDYLDEYFADGNREHMVRPGMVYISYPTEYGTIYSLKELKDIYSICKKYKMPLFIDGARLGYGLMSKKCDLTIKDIAKYSDVFYIGGTKVGALSGEAVVFTKKNVPDHFISQIKQHGALLAKGRLNGIQFDTLFTDGLYYEISKHAIDTSEKLKKIIAKKGYKFYLDSPTNQQFFIIENSKMKELAKHVVYSYMNQYDKTHTVIRLCTSWSTSEEDLKELEKWL